MVIVYGKEDCPYCRALKRKLQHDGVTFIEYDVLKSKVWYDEMMSLNGGRSGTPTWLQDGKVMYGFHGFCPIEPEDLAG